MFEMLSKMTSVLNMYYLSMYTKLASLVTWRARNHVSAMTTSRMYNDDNDHTIINMALST